MVQIDRETIKYLTMLSRIACTEEEQGKILGDLKKILNYIDQLNEINTENVPPCNHVLEEMANVMREDIPENTLAREAFISNSPSHVGGLIRVPTVIKKG